MKRKKDSKVIKILICILIIAIICIGVFVWYNISLSPVKKGTEKELVEVEISEGMGLSSISNLLKKEGAIRSANAMKIYVKLNSVGNLQAGKYEFSKTESTKEIIDHIVKGEVVNKEIKITFIEGKNMRWIAKKIADSTTNSESDVYNLLKDEEYIDSLIKKYWFLKDEIKNEDIYYPLEGYLLPDTYVFENREVSVETIFNVLLNYMDKFLSQYKDNTPYNLTIHQTLTMASIAELEGKTDEDRAEVVGVFFNRLSKKMNLGSDVTTYYAFKVDMGERDLKATELNTENPYNTRGPNMSGKIPIGPICNPSKSAIKAVINYKETDALYFVADKNGKVYFTKTNEEHNKIVKELKDSGLWYTYD